MNQIFRDSKEPLYGRADTIMKLFPFTTSVLKEILADHKPNYSKEDLLALYTFTGGVPKYIEQFSGRNKSGRTIEAIGGRLWSDKEETSYTF